MAPSMPPEPTRGSVCSPVKEDAAIEGCGDQGQHARALVTDRRPDHRARPGVASPAVYAAEDPREGAAEHTRHDRIHAVHDLPVRLEDRLRIRGRETADHDLVPALMDRLLQDEAGRMFTLGDGLADGQYADVGAEVIYHGQDNIAKLCQRYGPELSDHFSWERRLRSSNSLPAPPPPVGAVAAPLLRPPERPRRAEPGATRLGRASSCVVGLVWRGDEWEG